MKKLIQVFCILIAGVFLVGCQNAVVSQNVEEVSDLSDGISAVDRSGTDISYNGNDATGKDIILQAFHWGSHNGAGTNTWYDHLNSQAATIGGLFPVVWLPPPSATADQQGYMPSDWANLSSRYGTQTDLKDLIVALHNRSVKVLADIVVNHRSARAQCSLGNWDVYNYSSFGMGGPDFMNWNVDVVGDGGKKNDSSHMTSGATEGSWSWGGRSYGNEDFGGSCDINHWNSATRNTIKSWLNWLKNASNAGFDGWRFDMIGGYDPAYLGEYNFGTSPYLSVGEKPTGDRQMLADMVNRSGNQTMVFDFPMRDALASALWDTGHMWGQNLGAVNQANSNYGLIGWWSQAAVTMVNNHDIQPGHETVGRSTFAWGLTSKGVTTQAAYAFILTHPGVPSVFYMDWQDRGADLRKCINNIIRIRQANNVKKASRVWVARAEDGLYAAYIGDQNAEQVAIKIGKQGWNNYETWVPGSSLGLTRAYTQWESGGHAYTVYYKNAVTIE